ncbi:hypothetical protein WKK05_40865 (plasmid) [Nostoc sp. UHCC 0302]|uniref:hypothetical protein n=1 Tax=Nostoc sp. UHCC 0302 TaxID=3134896 RepID=UPI00311CBBB4
MQPTISIPRHWGYPRFALEQRTKQGNSQLIIRNSQLKIIATCELRIGNCFGWRYALMPNKNSDEISYLQESQIQPLSPQELFTQITAEIDFYQRQISILQQQLSIVTGGFTNG